MGRISSVRPARRVPTMAAIRAWLTYFGSICDPMRREIAASLAREGVTTRRFDPDEPAGPGLVVFDAMSTGVLEFLCTVGDRGLERVLAIAATGAAMAGGHCWRLLRAGASDVIAWDHPGCPAGEVSARLGRWE